MHTMKNPILILLLSILVLGCKEEKKETFDVVIKNGNTIDVTTGKNEKQDIFISQGRILKITPSNANENYTSKKTIDATDKYILPGFWDNHVHFRGGDSLIDENKRLLKLFIANGITTVRDAGGDLTLSVLDWKEQIAKGETVGPTIFTSGPKIDGPNPTWAGSLVVENEMDIAKALDSLQALKTDFVKLYDSQISGEAYIQTIEQASKRGLITSGHMPFTIELNQAVNAGINAVEHLYYIMKGCSAQEREITQKLVDKEIGFWQAMPLLMASYQDSTAQKTFGLLKQNDVYVVPTLHIGKTLSYIDEVNHENDPYLKYMGKGIIKTYEGRINRVLNSSEKAKKDRKELDMFFGRLTKSLHEADVKLLTGSDSGAYNSYVYPGISFHKELEAMAASGIPPLGVLQTSAYNGSRFLKKESDYGTITVGKISDLVVLDENPLENIANTQKIHTVIKGNEVYDKNKLQNLLDESISH